MPNLGFEIPGTGGETFADWVDSVTDGLIAAVTAEFLARDGTAAKLAAGAGHSTLLYQDITVLPETDYNLSIWTRGDGTYAGRYFLYDYTGFADIIALTTTGVTSTTYTEIPLTFTTPAGCTTLRLTLECPATSGGVAYFDDLTLNLSAGVITMPIPTITSISPKFVKSGDTISIVGTNFGASQGTSTITISGVALAATVSWAATAISGTCPTISTKGAVDVVLTIGTDVVTLEKGIFVYDATDNDDLSKAPIQTVTGIYMDGLHVGKTVKGFGLNDGNTFLRIKTDDSLSTQDILRNGADPTMSFTLLQITGPNLAAVLNGSWTVGLKRVTVNGASTALTEHSLAIVLGDGTHLVVPRFKFANNAALNFVAGAQTEMPMSADVLALNNGDLYYIDLP